MPVDQTESRPDWFEAQCADACSHLSLAVARLLETDDQITLAHVREALEILGEKERYMVTMSELYEMLELDYRINGRKTLRNPKQSWNNHLQPVFGNLPAHSVSADKVITYIAQRQKEGAENATINRETAVLARAFALAKQAGKIARTPYITHLVERNIRRGFLADQQFDALAVETRKIGLWMYGIFLVAFTYGWRKSELLRLRVRQCDFVERSITLDPGTTKNDDARQVQMTDEVFDVLQRCVAGKGPEAFVFTRERESNGRRTKTQDGHVVDLRDDWAKACAAAGCKGLLMHDLRRTAVRNLVRAGVSEQVAMQISGHKTLSVFHRYRILDPSDLKDAALKLQNSTARRRAEGLFDPEPKIA